MVEKKKPIKSQNLFSRHQGYVFVNCFDNRGANEEVASSVANTVLPYPSSFLEMTE
jgi:hypothetical protein